METNPCDESAKERAPASRSRSFEADNTVEVRVPEELLRLSRARVPRPSGPSAEACSAFEADHTVEKRLPNDILALLRSRKATGQSDPPATADAAPEVSVSEAPHSADLDPPEETQQRRRTTRPPPEVRVAPVLELPVQAPAPSGGRPYGLFAVMVVLLVVAGAVAFVTRVGAPALH